MKGYVLLLYFCGERARTDKEIEEEFGKYDPVASKEWVSKLIDSYVKSEHLQATTTDEGSFFQTTDKGQALLKHDAEALHGVLVSLRLVSAKG